MEVRKFVMIVEEVCQEAGKRISPPHRKVASLAVVKNPLPGKYVESGNPLFARGIPPAKFIEVRLAFLQKGIHPFAELG